MVSQIKSRQAQRQSLRLAAQSRPGDEASNIFEKRGSWGGDIDNRRPSHCPVHAGIKMAYDN